MTRNFLINEANIQAGRIWTFVTSCFSHSSGTHIFVNCLGLYFMAPAAAQYVDTAHTFFPIPDDFTCLSADMWKRS